MARWSCSLTSARKAGKKRTELGEVSKMAAWAFVHKPHSWYALQSVGIVDLAPGLLLATDNSFVFGQEDQVGTAGSEREFTSLWVLLELSEQKPEKNRGLI